MWTLPAIGRGNTGIVFPYAGFLRVLINFTYQIRRDRAVLGLIRLEGFLVIRGVPHPWASPNTARAPACVSAYPKIPSLVVNLRLPVSSPRSDQPENQPGSLSSGVTLTTSTETFQRTLPATYFQPVTNLSLSGLLSLMDNTRFSE